MLYVSAQDGESFDTLLSRFRSTVTRSGILRELKERRFFMSNSQKARMAARKAARRRRRSQRDA